MNLLQNYILQKGLTQKELSKQSGVRECDISKAKNSRNPSFNKLLEISTGMNDKELFVEGIELGYNVKIEIKKL